MVSEVGKGKIHAGNTLLVTDRRRESRRKPSRFEQLARPFVGNYDGVALCWKLSAAIFSCIRFPACKEPMGAFRWVSLTSPKGAEPRSARIVRARERIAGHGLSPRGSSSGQCSSSTFSWWLLSVGLSSAGPERPQLPLRSHSNSRRPMPRPRSMRRSILSRMRRPARQPMRGPASTGRLPRQKPCRLRCRAPKQRNPRRAVHSKPREPNVRFILRRSRGPGLTLPRNVSG